MRKHVLIAILLAACGAVALAQQRSVPVQTNNTPIPLSTTTELQQNTATNWANAVGLPTMLRGSTSLPSAITADRPVVPTASINGQLLTAPSAVSFGGASTCYLTSAATTNATLCANSAGTIYDISIVNTTATLAYLRLYNLSAAPTCSSATGFVESIPVPASISGAGIVRTFPVGRSYTTGISFCFTGGGSSTDNTSAGTGSYISIGYKQ
jgi:hypothetical protein